MTTLLLLLLALAHTWATVYAQLRLADFTRGARRVVLVRALLIGVGIAAGALLAARTATGLDAVLGFLVGFGLVHVPAAVILFVKQQRGGGKT